MHYISRPVVDASLMHVWDEIYKLDVPKRRISTVETILWCCGWL